MSRVDEPAAKPVWHSRRRAVSAQAGYNCLRKVVQLNHSLFHLHSSVERQRSRRAFIHNHYDCLITATIRASQEQLADVQQVAQDAYRTALEQAQCVYDEKYETMKQEFTSVVASATESHFAQMRRLADLIADCQGTIHVLLLEIRGRDEELMRFREARRAEGPSEVPSGDETEAGAAHGSRE